MEFARDAKYLELIGGWKLIDAKSEDPSKGVYNIFLYRGSKVLVIVEPTVGYPNFPPAVIVVSEDESFFERLGDVGRCMWDEAPPKSRRGKMVWEDFVRMGWPAKRLHILEGAWRRVKDVGALRLLSLHEYLVGTLGLKPYQA